MGADRAGHAIDGQPRFDLDQLDQAYFDRLRERVAPPARGIYVSVMLFDGWALHLSPRRTTSRATRSPPRTT